MVILIYLTPLRTPNYFVVIGAFFIMSALLKLHFWDLKMNLLIFNLLGIAVNNKCPELCLEEGRSYHSS